MGQRLPSDGVLVACVRQRLHELKVRNVLLIDTLIGGEEEDIELGKQATRRPVLVHGNLWQ